MRLNNRSTFKAVNDNEHNQSAWNVIHKWLDLWFENNKVCLSDSKYNQAVHYMYELINRPWLSEDQCQTDALMWLRLQARKWNVKVVWPV